ncbi:MAG: SusD family protein [Bacteroidetes bacterium ADurb.Bin217]|nr:MAG: SusD family protein [Bacteroidetes bacterium ADurb.Bin217]
MVRIVLYISLICLFSSCSDNFLDKQPSYATPTDKLFASAQGIKSALNGCYNQLQSHYYYGRNFILIQETYTDNAKLSNTNVGNFSSFYNWSVTSNNEDINQLWAICYNIITNVNAILEASETHTELSENERQTIQGEAYTLRALVYFDLIRMFAHEYTTTSGIDGANGKGGHLGVPLITQTISLDSAKRINRATVATVFSQIISDALKADTLLINQTFSPLRCNQKTAQSIAAMIYLTIKDYNKAIEYANKALETISLEPSSSYVTSWQEKYSSESIFSVSITETDNPGTNSIGHMLSPKGYGGIVPSADLLNLYSNQDIRSQFIEKNQEDFFIKYPGQNNVLGIDNIPIIRASELYFIIAESYANKGKTVAGFYPLAQQALEAIVHRANNSAEPITLIGDELISKIHEEYRKEFAFEGKRFFQLKRMHADISRTNCISSQCNLIYGNSKFTFPIPYTDIQTNKNILQNPGY